MAHNKLSADEQLYHVHNEKEILQILADLIKRKVMLNVSFGQGAETFLTTVIGVNAEKHLAFLDVGRDETFNSRLVASHDVTFTNNEGVRIRWTSEDLKIVTLKDGLALCIGLPRDLIRVQRRQYHRLATPIRTPVICRIPLERDTDTDILELPLADVSVGGIGIVVTGPLDERLSVGAEFDNCRIEFPDVGTTNLRLHVRYIDQFTMRDDTVKHRIGLEFINPSRGNQALIQRYTFILESESVAMATS